VRTQNCPLFWWACYRSPMSQTPREGDFFPEVGAPEGTSFVNGRCLVRTQGGHRIVVVAGVVIAQYALSDRMAEAHAMVSLIDQGWAEQKEVARAFGCSVRSARRHPAPYTDFGHPSWASLRKDHPRAMSISRRIPIPTLSAPGSPSCRRPA
jgi:hypothetical protein